METVEQNEALEIWSILQRRDLAEWPLEGPIRLALSGDHPDTRGQEKERFGARKDLAEVL